MSNEELVRRTIATLSHEAQQQAVIELLHDSAIPLQVVAKSLQPSSRLDLCVQLVLAKMGTSQDTVVKPDSPVPSPLVIGQLPKARIPLDTAGTASGMISGHSVVVRQFSGRRFRTTIDGEDYARLTMDVVEGMLGLQVHRKKAGGNSETLARALWRELVGRYVKGDATVKVVL
ncbi:MAG: hypothetical protein HYU30_05370 [Chloroflexi bacterium]|nr:hypothetical protein [Chloroflexota bacterium]